LKHALGVCVYDWYISNILVLLSGWSAYVNQDLIASTSDINTGKGVGGNVEIGTFPAGTQGFYVTGSPALPIYFAFSDDGSGLALSRLKAG
jgi:hypothetical protein